MTRLKAASILSGLILLGGFAPRPAQAQFYGQMSSSGTADNIEGFAVVGKGHVLARPNSVEIDLEVSASSELTADAIVKYRDARKKIHRGVRRPQAPQRQRRRARPAGRPEGADAEPLLLHGMHGEQLAGEDRGPALAEAGRQGDRHPADGRGEAPPAGLEAPRRRAGRRGQGRAPEHYNPYLLSTTTGSRRPAGLVRFVLDDFDKLEDEAYEKAIADARPRPSGWPS